MKAGERSVLCLRNTEAQTKRPFPEASSRRRPRAQQQVVTNVKEHPHNPIPTRHGNAASIMPNKGHLRRPCCARGVGERRSTADCNGSAHIRNQICPHAGLPIRASDHASRSSVPSLGSGDVPPPSPIAGVYQLCNLCIISPRSRRQVPAGRNRYPSAWRDSSCLRVGQTRRPNELRLGAPCHGTTARMYHSPEDARWF